MSHCDKCGRDATNHTEESDLCDDCFAADWQRAALEAGIPASVVRGETKLRDHFSPEYIEAMRKPRGEE